MASSAGKPPVPKAAPPPPPDLDACIESMITLGSNAAALSTRNQTELITAMVGYCFHLSRDQDILARFLSSSESFPNGAPFPEMPAVREILADPALLQCVLSMLSYNPNTIVASGAQNTSQPPGSSFQMKQGRKRSPSEDVVSRKKPLVSPTPKSRLHSKQAQMMHPSIMAAGDDSSTGQLSEKSIPVFAATILYTVFQHVDHWPVQIMKAFAEDSFGPRNWVDDERCKAFISNLEMSLKQKELDDKCASAAEEAEAYFSSLATQASKNALNGAAVSSSQHKTLSSKERRKRTTAPKSSDHDSSSSGEEEVLESESLPTKKDKNGGGLEEISGVSTVSSNHSPANTSPLHSLFQAGSIAKVQHVRQRYHMRSRDLAFEAISNAFQDRLDSKSKQNVRLLQVLPSFLPIPQVRCLVSRHLERWLQSPALAGLARTLFARSVQELRCVEPPLPEDLELIDNILRLNLKANQLSMHIDHVTMIAKKIPTQNVAQLIFTHCLQGEKPDADRLRMLRSVYSVLDRKLAANALALSVSSLFNPASDVGDPWSQLQNIRSMLCAVVDALGEIYDGFHFVKCIIKAQSGMSTKSTNSLKATARLIFECTLLVTRTIPSLQAALEAAPKKANKKPSLSDFDLVDEGDLQMFRKGMLGLRKSILRWCTTELCHAYQKKVTLEEEEKCADAYYERGSVIRGPGAGNYDSVLDVNSSLEYTDSSSPFHRMMALVRCLLFLSLPSSEEMEKFAMAEVEMDNDRMQRINFCCHYGVDCDDKMLRIILYSPNVTPNTALSLIENLLLRCGSNCAGKIDCNIETVWDIYRLAEYVPKFRSDRGNTNGSYSSNGDASNTMADDSSDTEQKMENRPKLPRLAITSMWWRVSCIALILSGLLPEKVGSIIWDENPTLRALIRMTTSQKYRFPTANCNEMEKERIKAAEERVRQEEANIAELLFMPPQQKKNAKPKPSIVSPTHQRRGLRSSARQREKKEKIIAIEEERQAAALHAENMKLRKVLRTLQKNIMLWDPKQEQRKPPKGSIDLLLSANDCFDLAEKFRLNTSPDFLLQTVGEGRTAIERAYDWLIPIISCHPKNIIDRLQPSASCFLLVRAYAQGVKGDKNSQLLDLTAPLLSHVSKCLTGEFGKQHALLAMELLLQDIADESDDRRRCARKVLQETVGDVGVLDSLHLQQDLGNCGWLFRISQVKNSRSLIPMAIKYLSHALAYERGKVLSLYISALSEFNKLNVDQGFDFVSTLCELIAVRHHVCSDAFDRFPRLRALCIDEVKDAFEKAADSKNGDAEGMLPSTLVTITIPKNGSPTNMVITSNLLHAAIILISNWQSRDSNEGEGHNDEESAILPLLGYLVIPFTDKGDSGLSSAKYKHNEQWAVSVEEWVLLAKARSEKAAKHAALSAPNIFLPRLLLCCGMPKTSFHTMLSRLNTMAESTSNLGKTYEALISKAHLPGIGNRRTIKRKLYGRILAYKRIHAQKSSEKETQEVLTKESSPFIAWLSSEIGGYSNTKKSCLKSQTPTFIAGGMKLSLSDYHDADDLEDLMEEVYVEECTADERWSVDDKKTLAPNEDVSQIFVKSCVTIDQYHVLEESLGLVAASTIQKKNVEGSKSAAKALLALYASFHNNPSFVRIMLKWVPLLTQDEGDEKLWQLIFISETRQGEQCHLISLVCECALTWSDEHVAACQAWILSQQTEYSLCKDARCLETVLRFLVLSSSEQKSIHCFDCDDSSRLQNPYSESEEGATSLTNLALSYVGMKNTSTDSNGHKGQACGDFNWRNDVPDWLSLILLVGKSHQVLVTRLVLEHIDRASSVSELYSTLLRLYIMFPLKMNLGDSKLRNALLQASNDHLPWWIDWRCPLDGQLSEMLSNLTKSPHQRLVQSVTDIAKQHPLLFVRHLKFIKQKLLEDGSGRDSDEQSLMKRGRIFGKHPFGDAVAQIGDRTVRVTVVLWGYSFNEPVWTSVLDVMMALPVEVAFSCGAKMGLTAVLGIYLKLFAIQVVELDSESNIVRIREKFAKFIELFRKCKTDTFEDWAQHDSDIRQLLSVAGIDT